MFPPDLLHRKLQFFILQIFLIYADFSRLFLSAILYDLYGILQGERLVFRLYDALKNRSTGCFSFLAILQYSSRICDCTLSINSRVYNLVIIVT